MKKITYVTGNKAKIDSARQILEPLGYVVDNIKMDTIEIQADTTEEVAIYSAKWASEKLKCNVLKNDLGLYVEALNGFPGVYTHYADDTLGEDGLLKLLDGVENRKAYFKEVLAYCEYGKEPITFTGITYGTIAKEKSGRYGWSWDFIFIPDGQEKTLGYYPDDERWKFWSLEAYEKLVHYLEKKDTTQLEDKRTEKIVAQKDVVNLLFGDSIAYGVGDDEHFGWFNRMQYKTRYRLNHYYCNLSMPGQSSCDIISRFEQETKSRFNEEDHYRLLFAFGIKDALLINQNADHDKVFKENIIRIINIAKKYTNDITFLGLLDVDLEKRKEYNEDSIRKINSILKEVCESHNVHFINITNKLDLKDLCDGLHPNSIGHEILATYICDKIYKEN
ncbi:MAG: non-canonical purine NTP pyrophosphatase [Bacilli bacterium]|nr:non-canonical purine NTP pyrophosphatase [Bacilli bacterium]